MLNASTSRADCLKPRCTDCMSNASCAFITAHVHFDRQLSNISKRMKQCEILSPRSFSPWRCQFRNEDKYTTTNTSSVRHNRVFLSKHKKKSSKFVPRKVWRRCQTKICATIFKEDRRRSLRSS